MSSGSAISSPTRMRGLNDLCGPGNELQRAVGSPPVPASRPAAGDRPADSATARGAGISPTSMRPWSTCLRPDSPDHPGPRACAISNLHRSTSTQGLVCGAVNCLTSSRATTMARSFHASRALVQRALRSMPAQHRPSLGRDAGWNGPFGSAGRAAAAIGLGGSGMVPGMVTRRGRSRRANLGAATGPRLGIQRRA